MASLSIKFKENNHKWKIKRFRDSVNVSFHEPFKQIRGKSNVKILEQSNNSTLKLATLIGQQVPRLGTSNHIAWPISK